MPPTLMFVLHFSWSALKVDFGDRCLPVLSTWEFCTIEHQCSIGGMSLFFVSLIEKRAIPFIHSTNFNFSWSFSHLLVVWNALLASMERPWSLASRRKLASTSRIWLKIGKKTFFQRINHKLFACKHKVNTLWEGLIGTSSKEGRKAHLKTHKGCQLWSRHVHSQLHIMWTLWKPNI
jgi:hypothetical protein